MTTDGDLKLEDTLPIDSESSEDALAITPSEEEIPSHTPFIFQDGHPVIGPPQDGLYEIRHESGHFISMYEKGKKNGETLIYNLDGLLTNRVTYLQDQLHGPAITYFPDQTIEMTSVYQNNTLAGPMNSFYPNGIKRFEGTFKQGKLEGEFIFYDEFGDVCQKTVYKEGLRHGVSTTYFPKTQGGGICQINVYENDLLVKNQDIFYTTGELLQRTPYDKGKPAAYPVKLSKKGKPLTDPANKNRGQ